MALTPDQLKSMSPEQIRNIKKVSDNMWSAKALQYAESLVNKWLTPLQTQSIVDANNRWVDQGQIRQVAWSMINTQQWKQNTQQWVQRSFPKPRDTVQPLAQQAIEVATQPMVSQQLRQPAAPIQADQPPLIKQDTTRTQPSVDVKQPTQLWQNLTQAERDFIQSNSAWLTPEKQQAAFQKYEENRWQAITNIFNRLSPEEQARVREAYQSNRKPDEVTKMIFDSYQKQITPQQSTTWIDRVQRIQAWTEWEWRLTSLKTDVQLDDASQLSVDQAWLDMWEFKRYLNYDSQKWVLSAMKDIQSNQNLSPAEKQQRLQQVAQAAKERVDFMKQEETKFRATAQDVYNTATQNPEEFTALVLDQAQKMSERDMDMQRQIEEITKWLADNTNALLQEKLKEQSDETRRLFDQFKTNQQDAFNDFRARELVWLVWAARWMARQRGIDIDEVNPSLIIADMWLAANEAFGRINDARIAMIDAVQAKDEQTKMELDRLQNEWVISAIEKDQAYKAADLATLQNINQIEKEWFNLATQEWRTEIDRRQQQAIAWADAVERILTSMGLSESQKQEVRWRFAWMRPEEAYMAIANDPSLWWMIQEAEQQRAFAAQAQQEFDAYLEQLKAWFKSQLSAQDFQQEAALQWQKLATDTAIEQAKLEQRQREMTSSWWTTVKPITLTQQQELIWSILWIQDEAQKEFYKNNATMVNNAIMNHAVDENKIWQPLTIDWFWTISSQWVDSAAKYLWDKVWLLEPWTITVPLQQSWLEYSPWKIAWKYESWNNYSRISTWIWDAWWKSYWAHQFSSKTWTLNSFIKWMWYEDDFKWLTPWTKAFDDKWVEMTMMPTFNAAQDEYLMKTHYKWITNKLLKNWINLIDKWPAVQEMLFSTWTQYWPATNVVLEALKWQDVRNMTDDEIISAVQDYKKRTVDWYFRSSSQEVRNWVSNRIDKEKADLLDLYNTIKDDFSVIWKLMSPFLNALKD